MYSQSTFYLLSYLLRSKRVTENTIIKIIKVLIDRLNQQLADIDSTNIGQ